MDKTQARYNPKSFASIMQAIYTLMSAEIEPGSETMRKLHQQHVRLRAKIQAAYNSQPTGPEKGKDNLPVAAIAMVALRRVEEGYSMEAILDLSKGKLLKLARKGLEK